MELANHKNLEIIICDIDGTISNNNHRQHLLKNKKNWNSFFLLSYQDQPILKIIDEVNVLESQDKKIFFITGRPEKYRKITEDWLKNYFKFEIKLFMRKNNDLRNKIEVKKEIFDKYFKSCRIFCVFENDPDLCKFWKDKKLRVRKVTKFDF